MKNNQYINTKTLVIIGIIEATILSWSLLIFKIPIIESLPYWFWKPDITPLPMWWLIIPIIILSFLTINYVLKHPNKTGVNISMLILLGWAVQILFSQMPGLGMYGITSRMTQTDHSLFAREAIEQSSPAHITTDYYKMIEDGEISALPHSTKPPGQLLFYMLTKCNAELFPILTSKYEPIQQIAIFSSFIYPLLTYLALIPLFYISKLLLPTNQRFIPLILYIFLPNVTLMTLHLDQCLYPLLFMTPLCLFLHGTTKQNPHLIFFSGILAYTGIFVTFSLVPILVLPCIYAAIAVFQDKSKLRLFTTTLALYFIGFACAYILMILISGYNAAGGYAHAMTCHQAVKISHWTLHKTIYIGFLDILEFTIWTGAPVTLLCITGLFLPMKIKTNENKIPWRPLAVSLFAIIMLMAFAGKTAAETGRLWIFILPLVCLSACHASCWLFKKHKTSAVLSIAALQLFSTFLTKLYQDFF